MYHDLWVAGRTVERPILNSAGFSEQGLFYLLKFQNFFWTSSKPKICLMIISPELCHCLLFNCNFYLLVGWCPALHIYVPLLPLLFPLWSYWALFCVFLHSLPVLQYYLVSPKKELNDFLKYQTWLRCSAICIYIDMFFRCTYVDLHFDCICDLIVFWNATWGILTQRNTRSNVCINRKIH